MNSKALERYQRQVTLKEFGEAGQQQLLQASVLVIGAGGLGCAALPYLVAAGIGRVGIVDNDIVALNNLHRQPLYNVNDIGLPKAEQAAKVLRQLNPEITIDFFNERLTSANALALLARYDLVVDGTDNFSSRYMINDACVLLGKPLVYGAVSKFEGQVAVFNCANGNNVPVNYRDLFPQPPAPGEIANCAEAGVLGVLPGIIGVMQANEAIKLLSGVGTVLANRLLTFNALNNQFFEVELAPGKETRRLIPADAVAFEQTDYDWLCGVYNDSLEIDTATFDKIRDAGGVLIADVREEGEQPVVSEFEHLQMPLSGLEKVLPAIAANNIVVFCQSGKRSVRAAALLKRQFGDSKKIYSLAGGILQWKQEHTKQ